jgi:broad specificity phosphatase PhoE
VNTRFIFLVRHGQNDHSTPPPDEYGGGLTSIGRQQATATADRLASLLSVHRSETHANEGLPPAGEPDIIRTSTLRRARQTAEVIASRFSSAAVDVSPVLEECIPFLPDSYLIWRYSQTSSENIPAPQDSQLNFWHALIPKNADWRWVEAGLLRSKQAYLKYFVPAQSEHQVEIIVSHGNMIRYLLCCALGVPERFWVNLDIRNCGISEVRIDTQGNCRVYSHNDTGHLPVALQTFI